MGTITYSVIIPHYNSPELLRRSLDSIPKRDDIQVIVVDDNSDPQKVDFDKFPGLNERGVEVVLTKKGGGAGYARNVGLSKAIGKWILFADTDDYFNKGAFNLLDKYVDSNVDYHCFVVNSRDSNTGEVGKRKITSDASVRSYLQKQSQRTLNLFKYKNFACWNKMISTAFLKNNNIYFEECQINNDVFFSFQIACKAKSFNLINKELYCCTYNPSSVTYQKRSVEREFMFYLQAKKRNGFYDALGLGWGFKRYDWIYLPYIIKKRGVAGAMDFYKYSYRHREELCKAEREYLSILG